MTSFQVSAGSLSMPKEHWVGMRKRGDPPLQVLQSKPGDISPDGGGWRTLASPWKLHKVEEFCFHPWCERQPEGSCLFETYGLNNVCNLCYAPPVLDLWWWAEILVCVHMCVYPNYFKSTKQILHFIVRFPLVLTTCMPNYSLEGHLLAAFMNC